jgi:hypothetical protein
MLNIPTLQHYKNVLLLNSSEPELFRQKRAMEMFGVADNIQAETNGISAMYYLNSDAPMPDLLIARFKKGEEGIVQFVKEYEQMPSQRKAKSRMVIVYDNECDEFEQLKHYRFLKEPLCVPELCDLKDQEEQLLN